MHFVEGSERPFASSSIRVKAKHTELPEPQSPRKVTKTRANKSYAQNASEIKPLSSVADGEEEEEEEDSF